MLKVSTCVVLVIPRDFIGEETKRTFIKPHYLSKAGFLTLGTLDILGQIALCYGGCPVHGRSISSIPDLYLRDARNISKP